MSFQIGDRVANQKMGVMWTGSIVGVMLPKMHEMFYRYNTYDDIYPDWKSKLLYTIELDREEKCISFEEAQKGGMCKEMYDHLPKIKFITNVEDDLILLERIDVCMQNNQNLQLEAE